MKKLSLELDALSVESFETAGMPGKPAGTVRAAEGEADEPAYYDCTCANTCVCKTAYYWCGDGYHTLHSCDYTNNESCKVTNAGYSCELPCTG
jgi:hypothetical protein